MADLDWARGEPSRFGEWANHWQWRSWPDVAGDGSDIPKQKSGISVSCLTSSVLRSLAEAAVWLAARHSGLRITPQLFKSGQRARLKELKGVG